MGNRLGLWMGIIFLMMLGMPLVSAQIVNRTLDVQIKLQQDNGITITDVNSQACIISIYSSPAQAMLYLDVPMVNMSGGFHHYTFTPMLVGDYGVDVKCTIGNETAIYYEKVTVEDVPEQFISNSAPSVLNLNVDIFPEKTDFYVNLKKDSKLVFDTEYYLSNKLSVSQEASYRITRNDKILESGGFRIPSTGIYRFDKDFKDYTVGDYKIILVFTGKTKVVDLKIASVSQDFSLVTGYVVNEDGSVNKVKLGLSIFFLIFVILLTLALYKFVRGGKKSKK